MKSTAGFTIIRVHHNEPESAGKLVLTDIPDAKGIERSPAPWQHS